MPEIRDGSSCCVSPVTVEREGKAWIELCSSRTYVPSFDDLGFTLRLECMTTDSSTGVNLSPAEALVTDPVITSPAPCPRHMISTESEIKAGNLSIETPTSSGGAFTVLSYNILADMYTITSSPVNTRSYTPAWALTWEYRRKNLLNEIIGYNADILCLQEVRLLIVTTLYCVHIDSRT